MAQRYGLKMLGSVLLIFLAFGQGGYAQTSVKKIGILIWANEGRYETSKDAFIAELKNEGFASPQVQFIIRRAKGSKVKAMQMAAELAALKQDLYFALGTGGTNAMSKAEKVRPIVFSVVYDPIEAGFVQGWDSSSNNLSGTANLVPMEKVLALANRIVPVKSLAVLYTPHEKNSESQLKDLMAAQKETGVTVLPVAISNETEIASSLPFILGRAQAIYVTGSIVIGKAIPDIVSFSLKNKILTISHLEDLMDKGIMVALSADAKEQGQKAGAIAVKVLNGALPQDIPIERAKSFSIVINKKIALAAGVQIPTDIIRQAKKIIE